jgi:hypothetical protein
MERSLRKAVIGDLVTIEGAGAYCSSMSTKNYNSFPESAEVMIQQNGEIRLIRRYLMSSSFVASGVGLTLTFFCLGARLWNRS